MLVPGRRNRTFFIYFHGYDSESDCLRSVRGSSRCRPELSWIDRMTSRFTRPNVLFQMNEADLEEMSKRNYRSGERWFVKDPCGIVCAVMTYCLVAYGTFAFLTILVPPFVSVWTMINAGIYLSLVALAIISHYKSMCTEPVSLLLSTRIYV